MEAVPIRERTLHPMNRRERRRARLKMAEALPLPPELEEAFLAVERMPSYADSTPEHPAARGNRSTLTQGES